MIWSTPSDRLCKHLSKVEQPRHSSNIIRMDTVDITGLVRREWRIANARVDHFVYMVFAVKLIKSLALTCYVASSGG